VLLAWHEIRHRRHPLAAVCKEKRVEKSIEISANLIKELKDLCRVIHIMALGWERHVPAVLEMAGL